jgi:hypothetical protein
MWHLKKPSYACGFGGQPSLKHRLACQPKLYTRDVASEKALLRLRLRRTTFAKASTGLPAEALAKVGGA